MPDTNPAPQGGGLAARPGRRFWKTDWVSGEIYQTVLKRFHSFFKPANYLEIGVLDGATLAMSECASIAIDPNFKLDRPLVTNKPSCCFYNMTSDAFFKRHSPTAIFGGPIELAFLDGMHWFEFLLRDFINVEKHCTPHSIVLMHDCIPPDEFVGRRDIADARNKDLTENIHWWAGDVWKLAAILVRYRPDLRLVPFNAKPTGLIAVTGLNASSTLLEEKYFEIVEEFHDLGLADDGDAYIASLNIRNTRHFTTHEKMSTLFWL